VEVQFDISIAQFSDHIGLNVIEPVDAALSLQAYSEGV
jgi:hypothetical protein